MKSKGIVRIESLRLKNFKNIDVCEICFSEAKKMERGILSEDDFSNVLGLYGQNGSGKTSCVEGLRILQSLLSGLSVPLAMADLMKIDSNESSIGADFFVKNSNGSYFVNYDCLFSKTESGLEIKEEKLSYRNFEDGKKVNAFSFKSPDILNLSFKETLGTKNSEIYKTISSLETKGDYSNFYLASSIFSSKLLQFLNSSSSTDKTLLAIINELSYFAKYRFAIYQINYFNEISNVGIKIRTKDEENDVSPSCGDVFVSFGQTSIKAEYFGLLSKTISSINKVLPSIIDECQIEIVDVIKTKQPSINVVNDIVNFRLMAKRGKKYIPLNYESNGTKKIISVLSGLIDVFNNEGSFVAIDEFDSGIFEYLLGELVYAFDNFALGQLFFTSHNMRILEKIDPKNIFFSTVEGEDRFVQIVSVRDTNNLRNLYYKYIANGYKDKYKLYSDIRTENIISAFSAKGDEENE
ncbi:MAG: AAA family ATPase [Bacilli bacterium]|nr:AAA family ATPase [Bacilli bacterium]